MDTYTDISAATGAPETETTELLARGLAAAPFAALLFRPDAALTLLWRNAAHERLSASEGRAVSGMGMFEAFPPSDDAEGSAAVGAIRATVERLRDTGQPELIGPYRFDLPDPGGTYEEYHWEMHFAPIFAEGELVAVLQTAQDVTDAVLTRKLAESHRRTSASSASVAYFSYDPVTDLFHRHAAIDAMFGFAEGEAGAHAAPFFARVHPEDLPAVHAEVARIMAAPPGEIASFDYRVDLPDAPGRFLRIRAEMATDPVDRRLKLVGTFVDLTDIEQNRRALARALELREALLQEANHRIMNSLQIALSMLRIEASQLIREGGMLAEKAGASMRAVEARVRAVADVHGLMQIDETMTTTDLGALLERLARSTRQSAELPEAALVFAHCGPPVVLDSNRAVSLGLIVNELLTNAVKYGAPNAAHPIRLSLAHDADRALRITTENALGTGDAGASIGSTGLGERLVAQFADQIGATVDKASGDSTFRTEIILPVPG